MSSQLAARARGQVLVAFGQADAELLVVPGELGDLGFQLGDAVGLAESGFAPGLLAQCLGEAVFELADAGGQTGGAFVGGEQVGLQRGPGDGRSAAGHSGWLGFAGVNLLEQVTVPV